jgi:hypothetical protein
MPSGTHGVTVSAAGVNIAKSSVITSDSASGLEVTLPVAHALSAWVKTDADTAAGNLTAGHGKATGTYDVYWTGGKRVGVGVTITVNACALEGGTGTDFPATADATVVICEQVPVNVAIDGDELEMLAVSLEYTDSAAASVGYIDCLSAAPASIETVDLVANTPQVWTSTAAQAKFTGDPITDITASHSNTTLAATLKLVIMQDATP